MTPSMVQERAPIVANTPLAERTYKLRLESPEIARRIRPGQFLMLRLPGCSHPLLGRPFALYDTDPSFQFVDIVYLVVGKMTGRLAEARVGEALEIWGPLGQPFLPVPEGEPIRLVAGGIGQTPFLAYARELLGERGFAGEAPRRRVPAVHLYYGVRHQGLAAGVPDFQAAGVEVHLASDDGSLGFHGFVTQLVESQDQRGPLVGCGPEPMLQALTRLALQWNVPCQVSLETPMACGVGICFSCVTKVCTPGGGWDYKRVCVDGPVFDARQLVWH